MAKSQNGYRCITQDETHRWVIPFRETKQKGAYRHLILAPGHNGFILTWWALWFHEVIQPLNVGVWDEWGWAWRPIRGETEVYSNHASGTAVDLNATLHPLGQRRTFKRAWQYTKIRARLVFLRYVVRWGGNYSTRADEMHFEINRRPKAVRKCALRLQKTPRGKRVLKANPNYWG